MHFSDIADKPEKTDAELALIQCIAILLTHPTYANWTPERIFETMRREASQLKW